MGLFASSLVRRSFESKIYLSPRRGKDVRPLVSFKRLRFTFAWWRAWGSLPVASWVKAASLYREGQFRRAIDLYSEGIASNSSHPACLSAQLDLAYCLFREGRIAESETTLQKILSINSHYGEAYTRLARLYLWIGSSQQAFDLLSKAADHIKFTRELSALFIFAAIDCRAPSSAIENALALSENSKYSLKKDNSKNSHLLSVAMATFLIRCGDGNKGLEDLQKCLNQPEPPFEALLVQAKIFIEEQHYFEARELLTQCLEKQSGYPEALSLLSRLYLAADGFDQPAFALNLAVAACQSCGWMSSRELLMLAEVYMRAGDSHLALMMAERAKSVREKRGSGAENLLALDTFITMLEGEVRREFSA